jgi:shikimate kinase
MMGAGKSTVGGLVARRLGWPFVDLDDEMCRRSGMSVAEIFAARGEKGFRSLESQCLLELLRQDDAVAVVSVGGGAVLDPDNRKRLTQAGTVAWLRARPETLAARVGEGVGRPLLAGTEEEGTTELVLEELSEARAPLYAAVADVVLDTDDLSPGELAERLLAALRAPGSARSSDASSGAEAEA